MAAIENEGQRAFEMKLMYTNFVCNLAENTCFSVEGAFFFIRMNIFLRVKGRHRQILVVLCPKSGTPPPFRSLGH